MWSSTVTSSPGSRFSWEIASVPDEILRHLSDQAVSDHTNGSAKGEVDDRVYFHPRGHKKETGRRPTGDYLQRSYRTLRTQRYAPDTMQRYVQPPLPSDTWLTTQRSFRCPLSTSTS